MSKQSLSLYERFHKDTTFQNKIINKNNFTYRNLIGILEKYLVKRDRILDIGCGAGTIDYYLADKKFYVTGVDISQKAIEACTKSSRVLGLKPKLKFRKLNFPVENISGKFDLVICSEILEHLEDDERAIKYIFDLLNIGGISIFSVPSKNAPLYKYGFSSEFDKRVGHLRRYSLEELKNLVLSAGFVIKETVRVEGIFRNFLFLNSIAGKFIKLLNKIKLLSEIIIFFDNLSIPLFGESDIIIVTQRTK